MARCRRLLRAKSSVDLTIVALALFVCVFIFRHLSQHEAVHFRQAPDVEADVDAGGQLLEISLNNDRQQHQQHLASQVELHPSLRVRRVDPRIVNIGDVRTPDCRAVSRPAGPGKV